MIAATAWTLDQAREWSRQHAHTHAAEAAASEEVRDAHAA